MSLKPSELIDRTIRHLDHPGKWIKNAYYRQDALSGQINGMCLLSAMSYSLAETNHEWDGHTQKVVDRIQEEFREQHPRLRRFGLISWNDDPSITHADVITALEKARISFEEQGR